MNRRSAQRADSVGMPQRLVLRHYGLTALRHQHHPLRTHSKKGSRRGSTSAERNENFIKLNKDWFCCFIHKSSTDTPSRNSYKYIQNWSNAIGTINALALSILRRKPLCSTIDKNEEIGSAYRFYSSKTLQRDFGQKTEYSLISNNATSGQTGTSDPDMTAQQKPRPISRGVDREQFRIVRI